MLQAKTTRASINIKQAQSYQDLLGYIESRQDISITPTDDRNPDEEAEISQLTASPGEVDFSRRDMSSTLSVRLLCGFLSRSELNSTSSFYRFDECQFGEEGVVVLAEVLGKMHHMTGISLSWNHFTNEQLTVLSDMLRKLENLQVLYIDGNKCTTEGIRTLSDSLGHLSKLHTLQLHDNNIGQEAAEHIAINVVAKGYLRHLSLKNNLLGPLGVQSLEIVLSSKQSHIEKLDISFNNIGKTGALYISEIIKCSRITHFVLEGNNLCDEGIVELSACLEDNNVLILLNLSGNSCGSAGASALSSALKKNTTLTELVLSRAKAQEPCIGEEGAISLADMLIVNATLKKLDIYWGCVGSKAGEALADALSTNSSLTSLNLGGNFIGPSALIKIQDALLAHQKAAHAPSRTRVTPSSPVLPPSLFASREGSKANMFGGSDVPMIKQESLRMLMAHIPHSTSGMLGEGHIASLPPLGSTGAGTGTAKDGVTEEVKAELAAVRARARENVRTRMSVISIAPASTPAVHVVDSEAEVASSIVNARAEAQAHVRNRMSVIMVANSGRGNCSNNLLTKPSSDEKSAPRQPVRDGTSAGTVLAETRANAKESVSARMSVLINRPSPRTQEPTQKEEAINHSRNDAKESVHKRMSLLLNRASVLSSASDLGLDLSVEEHG